ncbi:HlyD family secretion protein [Aquisphaera insulae]|uniref:HlyD family secretion protein n=1 Tax=Aquisphaera insulae TaxID=2712864 RepID=UPI00196B41EB|nr:HlyD family secretion protein [Aquisphaera insulae]
MPPADPAHDEPTIGTAVVPDRDRAGSGSMHAIPAIVAHGIPTRRSPRRGIILATSTLASLVAGGIYLAPTIRRAVQTVSTEDAYVNSHATLVAPRVQGQVARVLVDDNMRVSRGDLLVELAREPYQAQVDIKEAAVANAEAELKAAEAQARGTLGRLRGLSWKLQIAEEQVDNAVALLASRVEVLKSREATMERAGSDYRRARSLLERGAIPREEFEQRLEALRVAEASANEAREEVLETRATLGIPPRPEKGDLSDVPADINQTSSGVREALAEVVQCTSQIGLPWIPTTATPRQVLAEFVSRDRQGKIDRMMDRIVSEAPAVRAAMSRRLQMVRDLERAKLNLSYCDIRAEIDGIVMRRNVNPGNVVAECQSLMAIRSLTEIWIDANFKETQLADLRIGQRVEIDADMYGSQKMFRGRVSGFSSGTGLTLGLLPAQNATGNFVKIVQRLPVRIELENYDPERDTLFAGLSVTPYVFVHEALRGPWAGQRLQGPRCPDSNGSE